MFLPFAFLDFLAGDKIALAARAAADGQHAKNYDLAAVRAAALLVDGDKNDHKKYKISVKEVKE